MPDDGKIVASRLKVYFANSQQHLDTKTVVAGIGRGASLWRRVSLYEYPAEPGAFRRRPLKRGQLATGRNTERVTRRVLRFGVESGIR